jgi:hypothetical protein
MKAIVALRGGLNTSTDRSVIKPGQMTRCVNFEVTSSGVVRRALGYRRWSGGCWYGPPAFFMWGPAQPLLQQGSTPVGQWGLPGGTYLRNETSTWVDYGRLSSYTGRARLTYNYDFFAKTDNYDWYSLPVTPTTSAVVAVALEGREPIRPERLSTPDGLVNNQPINQVFGVDATWPLVSEGQSSDTPAVDAHEIIDRAWPAYWDQAAGQGIEDNDTLGNSGGVQSIPGYHPYGGIAGLTYWRDRLYVVADVLSMTFSEGRQAPSVGDIVVLAHNVGANPPYTNTPTTWKWYVERVIVSGGSWEDEDATGTILLIGGVPGAPTNAYPRTLTNPGWNSTNGRLLDDGSDVASIAPGIPVLNNETTGSETVMRLVGYADPVENGAVLWRSTDLYDAPRGNDAWERVDLGYEVQFKDGGNAFVVVNRLSSEAYLDNDTSDGSPPIEVTEWRYANTVRIGSVVLSYPENLAADDGTTVQLSSLTGGVDPRPRLSAPMVVQDFGFSVPEYSIITGVEVETNCYVNTGTGEQAITALRAVSLKVGDNVYGNKSVAAQLPSSPSNVFTFGSQIDLWDATISPESVNSSTFGVQFVVSDGAVIFDYVKVRVHYKPYVSTIYFRNTTDTAQTVTPMPASATVGTPILMPSVTSGLVAGDTFTITLAGVTGYNGTHTYRGWAIDHLYAKDWSFIRVGAPPLANDTSGTATVTFPTRTVTSLTRVGNTATVVCSTAHGLANGDSVTIAGATPAAYNGTWVITVENATTFKFTIFGNPATPATGSITAQKTAQTTQLLRNVDAPMIARITLADHGYLTGQYVTMAGFTQSQYNGTFEIQRDGSGHFNYALASDASATPTTSGTVTATRNAVSKANAVWYFKQKGDWTLANAKGVLTIYDVSNPTAIGQGNQIRSANNGAGTLYAITDSGAQRVYMPSSKDLTRNKSKYEWLIANFTRSVVFEQLFGCSGASHAFSFDGKYFIRIRTGLSKSLDRPRHLAEHNFQLALGYSFGDVTFSDLGYAESFSAVFDGASPASLNPDFVGGSTTVSVADPVHGLLRLPEQSLAVFCENSIRRITGSGGVFTEQFVRPGHGIIEYTARNVNGMVVFTDSLGIMRLRPTDLFGQLLPQYVSASVAELLSESEMSSISGPRPRIMFAAPFNNKNQYRLYFNDGSFLVMTMVGADMEPQFWIGQYDFVPFCVGIGVHSDKTQMQFAGHVYTANYLLPFNAGPGGPGSAASGGGSSAMSINPAWPFQLDVSSTWDTNAMPALATFFLGDMAEQGGLHAVKRFSSVSFDVRAYGYANMAVEFSTRFGDAVARRVIDDDLTAATNGRAVSVGDKQGGDYLNVQQYRTTISPAVMGEWLLMTVESSGTRDYDADQISSGIRWLRPFELGICAVSFDLNKPATGTETSAPA